jgi:inward rectifier potassium channel
MSPKSHPTAAERRRRRRRASEPVIPNIRTVGRPWEPHKDVYHFLLRRSWAGFFLVVSVGFLVANALFAAVYVAQPGSIANARSASFEDAFFFSVQTMATIGYGAMSPATRYAHVIVTFEALIGILSVALVTGITFSKFSRPTARIVFSDRMTVTSRDGVPHLVFRLANWRHNQVLEAQLRLAVLLTEKTAEGETRRRPIELPLVRDRNPLFSLTWQAMHRIDEASPFHGPGALERLRAQNAQLFITLYGVDETVGQDIHARHRYELADIVWGGRFRDLIADMADGSRRLDYRVFHEIELPKIVPAPLPAVPVMPPEPAGAAQERRGPSAPPEAAAAAGASEGSTTAAAVATMSSAPNP